MIRQIVQTILSALDLDNPELSIVLCGDDDIHVLNKQWRNKDKPTDVLSFPQDAHGDEDGFLTQAKTVQLGDVVISYDTAARQAQEAEHGLEQEVARLLVHGVLHLLGHDHVHGGPRARRMRAEEERILDVLARSRY